MAVEIIKMSSKGQIVIPQDIRQGLNVDEGSLFAVMSSRDAVILKKIDTPSKERLIRDLTIIAKEGKARLMRKGLNEADIPVAVERARRK